MTAKGGHTARHAYRDLAIAFLVMQFIVTVVRALLKESFGDSYLFYLAFLFAPSMLIIFPLAMRVIIKIKASRFVLRMVLVFFVSGIIFRVSSVFLVTDVELKTSLSLISSILIITFLVIVIYKMVINFFGDIDGIVEKLWASVCVYFMLGALFGTFYSILLILNPEAMGVKIIHPMEIYINGMVYSLNILSGFDPVYQNVSESFKMGAIMESVLGTLFLVILLGRLLGGLAEGTK